MRSGVGGGGEEAEVEEGCWFHCEVDEAKLSLEVLGLLMLAWLFL